MLPDEIRELTAAVSAHIDTMTDQVFGPIVDTALRMDGRGRRIAYTPQVLPIVAVSSVSLDHARADNRHQDTHDPFGGPASDALAGLLQGAAGIVALAATDYVVHDRWIERLRANFPNGPRMIVVDGVFGWLEPVKAKVETTLTAALASHGTAAPVASSVGFAARDSLLVGNDLHLVLTSVPDALTVNFDSVGTLSASKAIGTKVRTWGKTPLGIQHLATHMFSQFKAEEDARRDGQGFVDPSRIRKEFVDRYMYELFPSGESMGGRYDLTVRRYSRPAVAAMV